MFEPHSIELCECLTELGPCLFIPLFYPVVQANAKASQKQFIKCFVMIAELCMFSVTITNWPGTNQSEGRQSLTGPYARRQRHNQYTDALFQSQNVKSSLNCCFHRYADRTQDEHYLVRCLTPRSPYIIGASTVGIGNFKFFIFPTIPGISAQ